MSDFDEEECDKDINIEDIERKKQEIIGYTSHVKISMKNTYKNKNLVATTFSRYLGMNIEAFANIKSLEIDLFKKNITDKAMLHLSKSIHPLSSSLTSFSFNIASNYVTDFGISYFCKTLKHFSKLNYLALFLQTNRIENLGAYYVGLALGRLKDLEYLSLNFNSNEIETKGIEDLCTYGLSKLKDIEKLVIDISSFDFQNDEGKSLALKILANNAISDMTKLKSMTLFLPTNISLSSMDHFNKVALGSLCNIINLNIWLQNTKFNPNTFESFVLAFKNMKNLSRLFMQLSELSINDNNLQILVEQGIGSVKTLRELVLFLDMNEITDAGLWSGFRNLFANNPLLVMMGWSLESNKTTDQGENILNLIEKFLVKRRVLKLLARRAKAKLKIFNRKEVKNEILKTLL